MAMTGAERAKSFRERRALRELNIDLTPSEIKRKILNAQKSYIHSTGHKEIDRHMDGINTIYFLVKDKSGEGFYIFRRTFKKDSSKSSMDPLKPKLLSKEEADKEFDEIIHKKSFRWKTVDHYLEKAAYFDVKWRNDPKSHFSHSPLNQFSFIMAMYEVSTDGYQTSVDGVSYQAKGRKNFSNSRMEDLRRIRRYLTHLFGNPELPPFNDLHSWRRVLEIWFQEIANDTNEEGETSEKTYREKGSCILHMVDNLSRYVNILPQEIHALPQMAKDAYDHILEINLAVGDNEGTIVPSESYQPLAIETVEKLLERLWRQNRDDFHCALLGLSTLLRPTEIERLLGNYKDFLKDTHFLNYKGGKLITKTLRKADVKNLPNPLLPVVARLILFHFTPKMNADHFSKKLENGFRHDEEFSDCFFRRFRTTGAVMIKYCDTDYEAQTRLGHTTNQLLHKTYAPLMPSVENPEKYLNFKKDTLKINLNGKTELVSEESNLWDLWLLRTFMKFHLQAQEDLEKQLQLKRLCLEEARLYDQMKGGDASFIEDCVL